MFDYVWFVVFISLLVRLSFSPMVGRVCPAKHNMQWMPRFKSAQDKKSIRDFRSVKSACPEAYTKKLLRIYFSLHIIRLMPLYNWKPIFGDKITWV